MLAVCSVFGFLLTCLSFLLCVTFWKTFQPLDACWCAFCHDWVPRVLMPFLFLWGKNKQSALNALSNSYVLVHDQFVGHVNDYAVHREFIPMLQVWDEAIWREQAGRSDYSRGRSCSFPACALQMSLGSHSACHPSSNPASTDMAKLKTMLLKKQEQSISWHKALPSCGFALPQLAH